MIDQPIRTLLVEDNEHDQIAFSRALKKCDFDFRVTAVDRADAALHDLQKTPNRFDLIVTDYDLPGVSGLALARRLLAEEACPWPIVILTGRGSEDIAVQALKIGVYDYVIKDANQGYLGVLPWVLVEAVKRHHDKVARQQVEAEKDALIAKLQEALAEIKALQGILPICSKCKKPRDDHGYWRQTKTYISQHADVDLSHGLCPQCMIAHPPTRLDSEE